MCDKNYCYDWPSSEILFKYLHENEMIKGRYFADISAGQGKLGSKLLIEGAKKVCFTEASLEIIKSTKKAVLRNLKYNLSLLKRSKFRKFNWYDFEIMKNYRPHSILDLNKKDDPKTTIYVLISDCFYNKDDFEQLICTIHYWNSDENIKVIICQELRCPDWSIEPKMRLWHLWPEKVIIENNKSGKTFIIFWISKKNTIK